MMTEITKDSIVREIQEAEILRLESEVKYLRELCMKLAEPVVVHDALWVREIESQAGINIKSGVSTGDQI